jgi:hypothetical protein
MVPLLREFFTGRKQGFAPETVAIRAYAAEHTLASKTPLLLRHVYPLTGLRVHCGFCVRTPSDF